MKMAGFKVLLVLMVFGLLSGCSEDKNKLKPQDVIGFYNASLPCNDCPEIRFNLVLNKDLSYVSSTKKMSLNSGLIVDSGTYKLESNRLILTSNQSKSVLIYDVEGYTLIATNPNGQARSGANKEAYTLQRLYSTSAEAQAEVQRAFVKQTWLYAEGEDWQLSVDRNLNAFLKVAHDSIRFTFPKHVTEVELSTKTWLYTTATDSVLLILKKQPCKGNLFKGTEVNMVFNMKKRIGCAVVLDANLNLNKKWNLIQVNGQNLPNVTFPKGRPMIDIDVLDRTFVGITGCNFWRGGAIPKHSEVQFRPGPMTRMLCPDGQAFENNLVQSFGRLWKLEVTPTELRLRDGEESMYFITD